jgi:hypothetical protein
MLAWLWRKRNFFTLLEGMYISTATMENNIWIPKKNKDGATIWSNCTTPRYISKGNEISIKKSYPHTYVNCSTIHNSQDTEST